MKLPCNGLHLELKWLKLPKLTTANECIQYLKNALQSYCLKAPRVFQTSALNADLTTFLISINCLKNSPAKTLRNTAAK